MKLKRFTMILGISISFCLSSCNLSSSNYRTTKDVTNISNPASEDSLDFYDFIYQFSTDSSFQCNSINSPYTLKSNGVISLVTNENWNYQHFGFGIEFSTLLFSDSIIDFERDFFTKINDSIVSIAVFMTKEKELNDYRFVLRNNNWFLKEVANDKMDLSGNENFLGFLTKFSSDSLFVKQRILQNATYVYFDDEAKENIEQKLEPGFLIENNYLFNEVYICDNIPKSGKCSIFVKGEGAGYHSELYFENINDKWYLSKEINLGM